MFGRSKQEISELRAQLARCEQDLRKLKEFQAAVNILKSENASLSKMIGELRCVNTCLTQSVLAMRGVEREEIGSATTLGMSDAKLLRG